MVNASALFAYRNTRICHADFLALIHLMLPSYKTIVSLHWASAVQKRLQRYLSFAEDRRYIARTAATWAAAMRAHFPEDPEGARQSSGQARHARGEYVDSASTRLLGTAPALIWRQSLEWFIVSSLGCPGHSGGSLTTCRSNKAAK
jgi:hypothetical protein